MKLFRINLCIRSSFWSFSTETHFNFKSFWRFDSKQHLSITASSFRHPHPPQQAHSYLPSAAPNEIYCCWHPLLCIVIARQAAASRGKLHAKLTLTVLHLKWTRIKITHIYLHYACTALNPLFVPICSQLQRKSPFLSIFFPCRKSKYCFSPNRNFTFQPVKKIQHTTSPASTHHHATCFNTFDLLYNQISSHKMIQYEGSLNWRWQENNH